MALTLDQINSITEKKFMKKLVDNVFDSSPLLQILKDKSYDKLDGGDQIVCPLNYAQTTAAGFYTGADTLSTSDNENITGAAYTWKQAYAGISITSLDEKKNSGDAAQVSLLKSKMMIAEKTLADILGTALYNTGATANQLVGLRAIVASSNTIGGISQSTNTWWAAGVDDSSTTTFSISALQTAYNTLTINNETPDLILATRANYNRYYASLQPQQRFTDSGTAKAGFSNLMFNGSKFISDSKCPANHIFVIDTNYLHLWVHKDED